MKKLLFFVLAIMLAACKKEDAAPETTSFFLSDLRPRFFEHLNYESPANVAQIPAFLQEMTQTYNKLEQQYKEGSFKSADDLENMRLMGMYYSFYLLSLTINYLDANLTYESIAVDPKQGYFSKLASTEPDFRQREMEAMIERGRQAASAAVNINGFNDKAYGFYIAVRQIQERLKGRANHNNPVIMDSVILYAGRNLKDYSIFPNWNILMSMVTFSNYEDSLNTFKNPHMDEMFADVNARLVPGSLPDLGGKYPEILGPIYRFDMNLKKTDWLLSQHKPLSADELQQLDGYINTMDVASNYVMTQKKPLLNSWFQKPTFDERIDKLNQLKTYRAKLAEGSAGAAKPELTNYLNSKSFRKAYQCYSCHKTSGL
ncbi:MAG: hypothetical protein INR73_01240 [Williamsia sp.]|nr:hypothetical protein [Williamsia sp.]